MKLAVGPMIPMHVYPPPRKSQDIKFIITISFTAGLLIGIPLTYCLIVLPFLSSEKSPLEISSPSKNELPKFVTTDRSLPKTTMLASSTLAPEIKRVTEKLPIVSSLLVRSNKRKPNRTRDDWLVKDYYPTEEFTTKPYYRLDDLVDGIFWTAFSERFVPKGFDDYDIRLWKRFINSTRVVRMQKGCGRMQNRLLTLSEGDKACCRYRHNNDQMQGEIFSFYLGRILGLRNLCPSSLVLVDPRNKKWTRAASQIALAQWVSNRPVVVTQFLEDLQPAYVPRQFRIKNQRRLHPIDADIGNLTETEISELVQWSDLMIFDYLTGNLDRVVNNLYNERWNADMMNQPTHNLAKTKDGLLVFLDNESGLLHGYRLLEKYEYLHRAILDGVCIFRKDTADAVASLQRGGVSHLLHKAFTDYDPGMSDWLPFLPERSLRTLRQRIDYVHEHINTCKSRFEAGATVLEAPMTN